MKFSVNLKYYKLLIIVQFKIRLLIIVQFNCNDITVEFKL